VSTHAFKHRVPLPITHATYVKLINRWKVMPSVIDDLKTLWAAIHQDLDDGTGNESGEHEDGAFQ
jgi:hypothetical protein